MTFEDDTLRDHSHSYVDQYYGTKNDNGAYQNYGADTIYLQSKTKNTEGAQSDDAKYIGIETRPKNRKVVFIMKVVESVAQ